MKKTPASDPAAPREFHGRLDFYWQSIAVYAVALVIYSLFKGSVEAGTFSVAINDPVVILLFIFVVLSAAALAVRWYLRPAIVIAPDVIILRNRMRERRFAVADITRIAFGREGRSRLFGYRVIKIKIAGRRRVVRLRPSLFDDDHELMGAIAGLKRRQLKTVQR